MGTRTFELPDLGEGIAEGELVSWAVSAGDTVEQDEVIAEVETDKALVEIPSPYDGTVTELHYEEGDTVPVDAVVATFEVEGEGDEEATDADAAASASAASETTDAAVAEDAAESAPDTAPPEDAGEPEADVETPSGRVFAAPSTRSLARELGVDPADVDGSGPGGRVTGADVRAHARNGGPDEAEATTATTAGTSNGSEAAATTGAATRGSADTDAERESVGAEGAADVPGTGTAEPAGTAELDATAESAGTAASADRDRTLAMPATRALATELGVDLDAVPTDEERDGEAFVTPEDVRSYAERLEAEEASAAAGTDAAASAGSADARSRAESASAAEPASDEPGHRPGDRIPYEGIRRTIGERMAQSKYTAPHVSHHDEFDASRLVEVREELAAAAEPEGVNVTYLPFVIAAVTRALTEFPYLNSSLDEENDEIVLHDEYNIGIAVSTDAGLMVPVVENADQKGLKTLAREVDDLATRARNRTISPDELQGSTFTITNIGVIGGQFSSPIINHPEAAIFAMGAIEERPWVVDGEVVARPTMRISMSVDHRLVDGADAARFANRVQELLGEPSRLLL